MTPNYGLIGRLVATCCGAAAALALAGSASARTVYIYTVSRTVNGARIDGAGDRSACSTTLGVDQDARECLRAGPGGTKRRSQFDSAGNPQPFSARPETKTSVLLHPTATRDLAVDNSGGVRQGSFYAQRGANTCKASNPTEPSSAATSRSAASAKLRGGGRPRRATSGSPTTPELSARVDRVATRLGGNRR